MAYTPTTIADLSTETATDLKNKINAILAEMKKQGISFDE